MPKRTDISSILIVGSGPIVIGQACEFDYSGAQACKALKAEGYRVVLVNSNPATIMTDPEMADATYVEPLTVELLEKIIAEERPDALLPTVGGQTGLNLAVALAEQGILERHGVELIGANLRAMQVAEDRDLFKQAMTEVGLESPRSRIAHSLEEAREIFETVIGRFPIFIRPSFTLGGSGAGTVFTQEEFDEKVAWGLQESPVHTVLVEESLIGWKEYELEVMRGPRRQLRGGLLDRKSRPDGRPHRRQHHRGALADADRQGVPAPAGPGAARDAGGGRGDGRQQRSVRSRPGLGARGGD